MIKTHKGLKNRIKITKRGKLLHRRVGKRHLMSSKSGNKSRQLRGWAEVPKSLRRLLKRQYMLR